MRSFMGLKVFHAGVCSNLYVRECVCAFMCVCASVYLFGRVSVYVFVCPCVFVRVCVYLRVVEDACVFCA